MKVETEGSTGFHGDLDAYLQSLLIENTYYRQATDEACRSAWEVIKSEDEADLFLLGQVLFSYRRVNRVLDGKFSPSDPRRGGQSILFRAEDISFDLSSFRGLVCPPAEVKKFLSLIARLETSFYPLAWAKARLMPVSEKLGLGDEGELESVAESCVERAVWNSWQLRVDSPIEFLDSLRRTVAGFLHHLPYIARREIFGGNTITAATRPDEDGRLTQLVVFSVPSRRAPFRKAREEYYEAVEGRRMWEVLGWVEKMDPRLQLAFLVYSGYLGYDGVTEGNIVDYGLNASTLRRDYLRSLEEVSLMAGNNQLPPETASDLHVGQLAASRNRRVLQMKGRAASIDSPRRCLLTTDAEKLWLKLTDQERRVYQLAIRVVKRCFQYTNAEIATIVGLKPERVERILTLLAVLASGKTDRFVNQRGTVIPRNAVQHRLIRLSEDLEPCQLAALTPDQRVIFDLAVSSDDEGRYPDTREIRKKLGRDIRLGDVLGSLARSQWVRDLEMLVERALKSPSVFIGWEVGFLLGLQKKIRNGEPLRSETNSGPAWVRLSREQGLADCAGGMLKDKLSRLYL